VAALDLTAQPKKPADEAQLSAVDHHSATWAQIAKPFATAIFILVAVVVVLPFAIITANALACGARCGDNIDKMFDWAKTVLAPIVGFGSAVVGYYFGTRGTTTARNSGTETSDPGDEEKS